MLDVVKLNADDGQSVHRLRPGRCWGWSGKGAATAESTSTASTAETSSFPRLLGAGLIDYKRASFHFFSVHSFDGLLGRFVRFHFDKTKTLRAAAEFIGDHFGRLHGAVRREDLLVVEPEQVDAFGADEVA